MELYDKLLVSLLLLLNLNCFSFSENLNLSQNETGSNDIGELMLNNLNASLTIQNLCVLYDELETIHSFLKPKYRKLLLIIAHDIQNAIDLAEFLSDQNRVLPEKFREKLSPAQKFLYDEIMENLYIYYSKRSLSYILVYPRNMPNEILATYLTRRIIESAEEIKIALTCQEQIKKGTLNRMFQVASNILGNIDLMFNRDVQDNIIFLPLSIKSKCGLLAIIEYLEQYYYEKFSRFGDSSDSEFFFIISANLENLSRQEVIENHIIRPILMLKLAYETKYLCAADDMFDNPQRSLIWKFLETSKKLIELQYPTNLPGSNETLRCFQEKILSVGDSILNESRHNLSSLTGVFDFIDFIQSNYRNLSSFKNDKQSIENLCKITEKLYIVKLLCHIKMMSNAMSYHKKAWTNSLKSYAKNYLQKKHAWFTNLKLLYNNVDEWNDTTVLYKAQFLYDRIPIIEEKNQDFFKRSFFIVNNNTVKMQADFSCSKFKNGYNLQAKGKFLKLSEILNKKLCSERIKMIELFALDKIIIDEDLIKIGEEIQVNIIAPIWEIVSNRSINLDGVPGDSNWRSRKADTEVKVNITKGVNGLPGVPGGPGGTFFGVLSTSIDGTNLRISCNGGKGGDGQDGGNGIGPSNSTGNGGRRGPGGIHGAIKFFFFTNSMKFDIRLAAQNGTDGNYGRGGFVTSMEDQNENAEFFGKSDYNTEGYQKPNKSIILEDFGQVVKRYKMYILSTIFKGGSSNYVELYRQINNNTNILQNYRTQYFIEELTHLEKCSSTESNKSITLVMLIEWRQGIYEYNLYRHESEKNDEFTKVLLNLDTLVSRKIEKLEDNFYDHSVLMIETYLDECIEESERLHNAEVLVDMKTISENFKMDFDIEIEEARRLLENDLQEFLDERIDELNSEIKQVVKEVEHLVSMKKERIEELKLKRKELEQKLVLRILFGTMQILFAGLAFVNPLCGVVGTGLSTGTGLVESNLLDSQADVVPQEIQIPIAVTNSLEHTFEKYDQRHQEDVLMVEKKLTDLRGKMDEYSKAGIYIQPLIDTEVKIKQYYSIIKSPDSKRIDAAKDLNKIVEEEEERWSRNVDIDQDKLSESLEYMETMMDVENMINVGMETFSKISKAVSDIDQVDDTINQEPEDIQKLEDFKEKVHEHLEPKIEQIRRKILKKSDQYTISHISYLEFQKWKMDEYFAEVLAQLESWTEKFQVEKSVGITMGKLKRAINAVIRLHILIKEFHAKIKNADYLENMFSVPFQITNINDAGVRKSLTALTQVHYANDILDEYNKWILAFMQYIFPFIKEFPGVIESPIAVLTDPVIKAPILIEKMKFFKSHLKKRKAHGRLFRYTSTAKFGNGGPLPAFYTWNSSLYSTNIKNILQGKEVKLFANISEQHDLNAVKFRDVKVLFVSNDPKISEDMRNNLKVFSVTITHNGDSYYRCDDKVRLIKSGAFDFGSKFFTSRRRRQVDYNMLDYVLSPFATWTIRLDHIFGSKNFSALNKYANSDIQIELVGEGQYMYSNVNVCKSERMKFYGTEVLFN